MTLVHVVYLTDPALFRRRLCDPTLDEWRQLGSMAAEACVYRLWSRRMAFVMGFVDAVIELDANKRQEAIPPECLASPGVGVVFPLGLDNAPGRPLDEEAALSLCRWLSGAGAVAEPIEVRPIAKLAAPPGDPLDCDWTPVCEGQEEQARGEPCSAGGRGSVRLGGIR